MLLRNWFTNYNSIAASSWCPSPWSKHIMYIISTSRYIRTSVHPCRYIISFQTLDYWVGCNCSAMSWLFCWVSARSLFCHLLLFRTKCWLKLLQDRLGSKFMMKTLPRKSEWRQQQQHTCERCLMMFGIARERVQYSYKSCQSSSFIYRPLNTKYIYIYHSSPNMSCDLKQTWYQHWHRYDIGHISDRKLLHWNWHTWSTVFCTLNSKHFKTSLTCLQPTNTNQHPQVSSSW